MTTVTLKPVDLDDPSAGLVPYDRVRGIVVYWRTASPQSVKRRRRNSLQLPLPDWQAQHVGFCEVAPAARMNPRAINLPLEQIGRWHDAELTDSRRRISPLRPHDLRRTFAFHLAQVTGADTCELERRLGHRSRRYIQRYTNSPEAVAASYIEEW